MVFDHAFFVLHFRPGAIRISVVSFDSELLLKAKGATILCLLFVATASVAAAPELYVGAKGGANFSWITGADWEDDIVDSFDGRNRGRFGATVGGFVSAVFPSRYGLRAELLYTEHGGKVEGRVDGSKAELRFRTIILDVSLLGERYFDVGKGEIFVFLGPTLLVLQGDFVTDVRSEGAEFEGRDTYDGEQLFGATGGVGYTLPLGVGVLLFETRYTRGFTGYNRERAYDNAVTALAGYALPF